MISNEIEFSKEISNISKKLFQIRYDLKCYVYMCKKHIPILVIIKFKHINIIIIGRLSPMCIPTID